MALAAFFYKLTRDEAARNTEAAGRIEQSTGQLSTLFDRMYSDTFSLMREQFHGLQSQVFQQTTTGRDGNDVAQAQADQQIEELKQRTDAQITEILDKQQIADAALGTIREELTAVANTTIEQSRRVDADAERQAIREAILQTLRSAPHMRMTSWNVYAEVSALHDDSAVLAQIKQMVKEHILFRDEPPLDGALSPNEPIRLID